MIQVGLYVHIPFCRQRCAYCDFSSWAGRDELIKPYTSAVCAELSLLHDQLGNWEPATVYLGGGTPSIVPTDLLEDILSAAQPDPAGEITVEANPSTLSRDALYGLRHMGVNRLSIGMQSSNPGELAMLGRRHDLLSVRRAVERARDAGFTNISVDLIFGLPAQHLEAWSRSLETALQLNPEHLSLYALTLEPGTPLADTVQSGRLPPPDPDLAADMYDLARDRLRDEGYLHYEISNWARPGRQCRHNQAYWRNDSYIGAGAGAWGHWRQGPTDWRLGNTPDPQEYINKMIRHQPASAQSVGSPWSPACEESEPIDRQTAMAETMFMGLRLVEEGVSRHAFMERFGVDPVRQYGDVLDRLAATSLICWDENRVYLREAALLIANQVFAEFLPDQ